MEGLRYTGFPCRQVLGFPNGVIWHGPVNSTEEESIQMRITFNHSWGKKALVAAALGGFLMLSAAPRSRADEGECQHRIARADHKLHEAAEHHGWDSPQAAKYRHELAEARSWCWEHSHRWWDE